MKFTVFGGTGFIGSHLTQYLRGVGHEVLVPDRTVIFDSHEELGHVVYAIGMTGSAHKFPGKTIDAHVVGLLKRMEQSRYESWTYLSSTRMYLQSTALLSESSPVSVTPGLSGLFDISKLLGESLCLALDNSRVRVVRLSNVYGPGQSSDTFLGSIVHDLRTNREAVIREAPESRRDYIAIADVNRLIEQVATLGKERIYNLASGVSVSHLEIARHMSGLSGCPIYFEAGGRARIFPPLNIDRIKHEFDFVPRSLLEDLDATYRLSYLE